VIGLIGSAISGPPKSGSAGAAVSSLPQSTKVSSVPASPAAPALSPGQTKFVASIRSALAAKRETNSATDAQLAAAGQQVCTALGSGASLSSIFSAAKNAPGMSGKKFVLLAQKDLCPSTPLPYTTAEQQAIDSAQSYLNMGQGFSKAGLYQQLTSSAGEGFSPKLARFALAHIKVNWMHQAVLSAKGYVQMGGFSYNSLVQQLNSPAGEGFTYAQAVHGATVALR
jgi:host cell surface-exposed lipoprotein/uncharacterized protein DUF732